MVNLKTWVVPLHEMSDDKGKQTNETFAWPCSRRPMCKVGPDKRIIELRVIRVVPSVSFLSTNIVLINKALSHNHFWKPTFFPTDSLDMSLRLSASNLFNGLFL